VIFLEYIHLVERQLLDANLVFGHGVDNAFDEAVWLVMSASGIDAGAETVDWQLVLNTEQKVAVQNLTKQRIKSRKPLAYILNRAWFAGHEFFIDERAIIPRSYIGEWISDRFVPWLPDVEIKAALDLCTGSGCIAISVALAFPEARIDAADISYRALEVASINVMRHALGERVHLLRSDLFKAISGDNQYDLIVCNPPYVSDQIMASLPLEYGFEPKLALAGGGDGLFFISRMLAESSQYLSNDGSIFIEVGGAANAIEKMWPKVPFTWLTSLTGESVILLLTAEELNTYSQYFNQHGRQQLD